jgi:hypothetical protein
LDVLVNDWVGEWLGSVGGGQIKGKYNKAGNNYISYKIFQTLGLSGIKGARNVKLSELKSN